jgi:hypothetical protein
MIATPPETESALEKESLRTILESQFFDRAETQKKVLLYLWAQRGKEFSEYAIATDALGRRADFDPKIDATVRVQVSRLRRKLKEFYETEGRSCPLKLHIPVGSHYLEIADNVSRPAPELSIPPSWIPPKWLLPATIGLCVVLMVLSGWLLWSRNVVTQTVNQSRKEPSIRFWSDFIGGVQKTQIVLPTPVFLRFPSGLRIRDIDINDFQNWNSSQGLTEISRNTGNPILDQSYTVTSDTFAAIGLARYLDAVGLGSSVVFNNNANASMGDLESSNEIAFGAHGTMPSFQPYLDRMNFVLTEGERTVEVRNPIGTEPKSFRSIDEGYGHTIEPGIIAVLPGKSATTKLLILQSRRTSALVTMLTSSTGSQLIEKMWEAKSSPRYYEVAVFVEMNGDHMIRAWPVALHAFIDQSSKS